MASAKLYLRPIGLLYGAAAEAAVAEGLALPLAGGPIAFTAAELIEGDARQRKTAASSPRSALADAARRRSRRPARARHRASVRPSPASRSIGRCSWASSTSRRIVLRRRPLRQHGGGDRAMPPSSPRRRRHRRYRRRVDAAGLGRRRGGGRAARVMPVIEGLEGIGAVISIDTRKASVARAAAKAGATIFNDVSALTYDPQSLAGRGETGLAVVLMHAQGRAQDHAGRSALRRCGARGVRLSRGAHRGGRGGGHRALAHRRRSRASASARRSRTISRCSPTSACSTALGVPLLVGASRKRFIQGVAGGDEPRSREPGSHAAAIAAAAQGAQILRVHDVAGTRQALAVWRASAVRH